MKAHACLPNEVPRVPGGSVRLSFQQLRAISRPREHPLMRWVSRRSAHPTWLRYRAGRGRFALSVAREANAAPSAALAIGWVERMPLHLLGGYCHDVNIK